MATDLSMQWDDVRYFLALVRLDSLSAAARFLKVEHSTVSRRISSLEASLSLKLFNRLTRRWSLTREGQVLFEQAKNIEEDMQKLQRSALGNAPLAGKVRLSLPPIFSHYFFLMHLEKFFAQYPHICLDLSSELRMVSLQNSEADLSVRVMSAPKENDFDLIARPLLTIHYDLYCSAALLDGDVAHRKVIGFDENMNDTPQKRWLDAYLNTVSQTELIGSTPNHQLRMNDMVSLACAAESGLGIALLPRFLAMHYPSLQRLPTPNMPPLLASAYLMMHPDVQRSQRVRAIADFILQLCDQYKYQF